MKKMKSTIQVMIFTGIGIIVALGFVLWILAEFFLSSFTIHEFNWWSVWGLLITFGAAVTGLIIAVMIMMRNDWNSYENRLKRYRENNGGGVNHENTENGFIRKGNMPRKAEKDHHKVDQEFRNHNS